MGIESGNYNIHSENARVFKRIREGRAAAFVCKWLAIQRERTLELARLDRFSEQVSEMTAPPFRLSHPTGNAASRFEQMIFRNSLAS